MLDRGTNSEQYLINQTVKRYSIKRMRASKRGFPIFKLAGVILLLAAIGAGVALVLNPQRIRDAKAAYTICETEGFVCKPSTYTCAQTFSSLNDCDDVYGSGYKCGKDCYLPVVKSPTPTPKPAVLKPTSTPTPNCQTGTFTEKCGYTGMQWCPKNTSCNTGWVSGPGNSVTCSLYEKLTDTGTYCLRWDGKRSWNGSVKCVWNESCLPKCSKPGKLEYEIYCGAYAGNQDQIYLSFITHAGAKNYQIQVDNESSFSTPKLYSGTTTTGNGEIHLDINTSGIRYYYTRVRILEDKNTICNAPSAWSYFGQLTCP